MYHFIRSSQDSSCGDLFGETFHCLGAVAVLQVGRSPREPDDMKALAEKLDRRHGWLLRTVPIAVLLGMCTTGFAQSRGRLTGVVRNASRTAVAGVIVIVTNQVTSGIWHVSSRVDGAYSLRLPPGAYRIKVAAPYSAKFEKGKDYGEFSIPRGDELENVIIEAGKDTNVDISVEEKKPEGLSETKEAEPAGYAGKRIPSEPQTAPDRREVRDRWRVGFPEYDRYGDRGARGRDIPFKKGRWWDPYNQSVLKGDYPIKGNKTFLIFSAVSTSIVEQRRAPSPSGVSAANPLSGEFFGQPEQFAINQTLQLSFELFHGDTAFRPRDWAIKISPTFSIPNYVNARENGIINIDVRRGTNRTDTHVSLEEAFAEVKLRDLSPNFDFISVRAGIQPFVSDFRGFIFSDNNLGARFFGSLRNNRYQYNGAFFSMVEKDTNSGLKRFEPRRQPVHLANLFRQDFIREGYTIQGSLHYNDDRASIKYDRNGFLVRPALIGDARQHSIKVG